MLHDFAMFGVLKIAIPKGSKFLMFVQVQVVPLLQVELLAIIGLP